MSPTPLLARLLQRHGLQSATFGSLFDIVGQSRSTFISQHGREFGEQAANLYDDALRQAVPLARRYREQRLSGPAPAALVDGQPTYQSLFGEDWRARSPEGALDADDSPVAYLCALYQWAQQMDAASDDGSGSMITLATRRPDLSALMLDKVSTDQTVTALSLVNEILCKAIETYSTKTSPADINTLLAGTLFPFTLPYDFSYQQITRGLDGVKTTLMSVMQQTDPTWPYFLTATLEGGQGANALKQGSQLSQEQQSLIMAASSTASPFYQNNYGVPDTDKATLSTLSCFASQTGLTVSEVQALLCTQGKDAAYSVTASPNVTSPSLTATPNQYGATYIHGSDTSTMTIAADASGNPDASTLTNTSDDRFDRMNRFIRLRNWMQLPFDKLDLLMNAEFKSEKNTSQTSNGNMPRTMGLYRELNRRHTVSPDTLAAWIYQISPYAIGDQLPFYDQLFNRPGLFDSPLTCDGVAFTTADAAGITTVEQICAGLNITFAEYTLLSTHIVDAQTTLARTLPVLSAFHRLATLPQTFGLSIPEGLVILGWLGGNALSSMAGVPAIVSTPSSSAEDILDIIAAFASCADWLQSHQLSTAALAFMATAPDTLIGTPAQTALIDTIVHDLASTLLTVDRLLAAGAPQSDSDGTAIDWAKVLASVLDSTGLVIDQEDLAGAIDTALAAVKTDDATRQLVKAQLLAADSSQQGVTATALASYLDADPALPPLLLQWAGSDSYAFLKATQGQDTANVITLDTDYLTLLYNLGRYQAAVVTFSLSTGLVQTYVSHPGWFNDTAGDDGSIPLTLATLYRFSRYNDVLDGSTSDESELLDYLAWVNASTSPSASDAANRLAALIDWSGDEVALAAAHMETTSKIATTLADIDGVVRLQTQWQQTGLSTDQQIKLAALSPQATAADYHAAGQSVVAALQTRLDGSTGTTLTSAVR